MKNSSSEIEKEPTVWTLPVGFLLHIDGLPYETTAEVSVKGFVNPFDHLQRKRPKCCGVTVSGSTGTKNPACQHSSTESNSVPKESVEKSNKTSRECIDSAYNDFYDAEFEVIAPDGQRWKIIAGGDCYGFPPGSSILNGLLSPINRLISEVIISGKPETAEQLNSTTEGDINNLDRSTQFMESLDPEALLVGDGSDHLPVWIGIDAESGKVFKIYATGLAQGFGDVRMTIINGMKPDQWHVRRGEQVSFGNRLMLSETDNPTGENTLRMYEASPGPIFKNVQTR
nr:hypothetical protein [Delftia acidovorans]